jgi:glycosyltransferase involved in cell wall biosynthesis
MYVSIIIPTFNRANILRGLLDKLACQTYPSDLFEVLVCSDSTDTTEEIVNKYQADYVIRIFNRGLTTKHCPAVARNVGIYNSNGSLLIFLDDDRYPVQNLVAEHVKSHKEAIPDKVLVYGPRYGPDLDRLLDLPVTPEKTWDYLRECINDWSDAPWQWAKTSNLSVMKEVLLQNGAFDERFQKYGYEDTELVYRLKKKGYRFVFNPKATNIHMHVISPTEQEKKIEDMKYTKRLMKKIHPDFPL